MSLITKSDCMSVTDLNHTVGDISQVIEIFSSKFLNVFFDSCLPNISDQFVVAIVFSCL